MDVEASVDKINQNLERYPFGSQPEELYQPLHYMLSLDQKRIYPLLTFWGCYLFSGDTNKALLPALGIEVFHKFFMVHEDILDRNDTRNGNESVHIKWNDNVAILSGDAMVFKAYELLIQVDPNLVKTVVRLFNECFTNVCESKQIELNNQKILKTGALSTFSLQLGALIGGATQEQGEQIRRLGIQSLNALNCDDERKRLFESWVMRVIES